MPSSASIITGPLRFLRRPFEANVKAGDKVLVVTDTAQDSRVWQAIMTIVADLEAEPTLALFEPRPADYYDPPSVVAAAMLESDVNVLVASTAMGHSPSAIAAMRAGTLIIQMDGQLTLETFQHGAATADYLEIARMKHYTACNVYGLDAQEVRVTSSFGSDITYGIAGRVRVPPLRGDDWNPYKAYRRTEEGMKDSPRHLCLFPGGVYFVAPVDLCALGVLVVEVTMHHLGRLTTPIELKVENGRIVDIGGGPDAWRLRRHLQDHGDDNAYLFPTEASIGLNRKARIVGDQREDKNIYGSMHFGLGTNSDVGGTISSNLHMDGVILEPTLYVDGVKRLERGEFLVPMDSYADSRAEASGATVYKPDGSR
jgi:leucyl aminopeptidase (aminopeptidase T)